MPGTMRWSSRINSETSSKNIFGNSKGHQESSEGSYDVFWSWVGCEKADMMGSFD